MLYAITSRGADIERIKKITGRIENTYHRNLCDKDIIIVLGDLMSCTEQENGKKEHDWSLIEWFGEQPYTVCFIDGNKDDIDAIKERGIKTKRYGNYCLRVDSGVLYLHSGYVYSIPVNPYEYRNILAIGGAEDPSIGIPNPINYGKYLRNLKDSKNFNFSQPQDNLTTSNNILSYSDMEDQDENIINLNPDNSLITMLDDNQMDIEEDKTDSKTKINWIRKLFINKSMQKDAIKHSNNPKLYHRYAHISQGGKITPKQSYIGGEYDFEDNNYIDYVISHEVPSSKRGILAASVKENQTMKALDVIASNIEFKTWLFGGYNVDKETAPNFIGINGKPFVIK